MVSRWQGPRERLADVVVVLATLLATAMGGSTESWAQTVLVAGLALLWLVDPPRQWPPAWLLASVALLALWPLVGYLPADWFGAQPHRVGWVEVGGSDATDGLGVHGWVTFQAMVVWWSGLAWALYLVSRNWAHSRIWLLQCWVGGFLALKLMAWMVYAVDGSSAWWRPSEAFGFFTNPNDTGILLAWAILVSLALGGRDLIHDRFTAWPWLIASLLFGVALMMNGSPIALGLAFIGALGWSVWTAIARPGLQRVGWSLAVVVVALGLFVGFVSPAVAGRLDPSQPASLLAAEWSWPVDPPWYQLVTDASWHGIGLGLFGMGPAQYAGLSAAETGGLLPANNWVWLGVELGWIVPVLILAVALAWLIRERPRRNEGDFTVRTALLIVGGLFLVQGCLQTAGHSPGVLWPSLFLTALLRETERSFAWVGRGVDRF